MQGLLLDANGKVNLDVRDAAVTTDLGQGALGMLRLMRKAVSQVQSTARQIGEATGRTARDTAALAQRTDEQALQLARTATDVQQLAATVERNSEHADRARMLAESTASLAGRGGSAVQQVASTMADISASSQAALAATLAGALSRFALVAESPAPGEERPRMGYSLAALPA